MLYMTYIFKINLVYPTFLDQKNSESDDINRKFVCPQKVQNIQALLSSNISFIL